MWRLVLNNVNWVSNIAYLELDNYFDEKKKRKIPKEVFYALPIYEQPDK